MWPPRARRYLKNTDPALAGTNYSASSKTAPASDTPARSHLTPARSKRESAPGQRPNSDKPEDGFVIHIHPLFMTQMDRVAHLALYQLVVVNYGEFASSDDAEVFGAAALGITREEYYQGLCEMADLLEGQPVSCGV